MYLCTSNLIEKFTIKLTIRMVIQNYRSTLSNENIRSPFK